MSATHECDKKTPCTNKPCLLHRLTIRSITLKNRIVVSPMCQYSSHDGFTNMWHEVHLGSRAVGGAALLFFEAAAITAQGRISPADLGIYKDEHIEGLAKIVKFVREQDCVPGVQLAHAGRKASHTSPWEGDKPLPENEGGWKTIGPSAIPMKEGDPTPMAMTKNDILQSIEDWKAATHRAIKCGFQVLEIHGAHGYLIHSFCSPLSNHRTDEYGGSFDNRVRYLVQVTDAVRAIWPQELPLFVRISGTDWTEGGWTPEDSVNLARILQGKGVDLIDCSSGGVVPAKIPIGPMYQSHLAKKVKEECGIMTGAVGLITTAAEAEGIIKDKVADLVFMARPFLRDPYFARRMADELDDPMTWPNQYDRAGGYKPRVYRKN